MKLCQQGCSPGLQFIQILAAVRATSPAFRSWAGLTRVNAARIEWLANAAIAAALLLLVLPLLLVIGACIVLQDGGPVLFAHRRIGRGGRPFDCLKLRTMLRDAEVRLEDVLASDPGARQEWDRDHKLRRDPRVTALGSFLRRSSLDELPQLINVIRGDMNLVGPRPIVQAEVQRYGRRFRHYCSVKPGITGLWQVSGRNDVSYRTRVAMDCLYARHRSPGYDVKLLVVTVPAILLRRGCY